MSGRSRRYSAAIAAIARPAPTTRSPRRRQFSAANRNPSARIRSPCIALARRDDDLEPGIPRRPRDRQPVRPEIPVLGDQKDQLRPPARRCRSPPGGCSATDRAERCETASTRGSRTICRQRRRRLPAGRCRWRMTNLFNPSPAAPLAETAERTDCWRASWLPAPAALSAAPCARRSRRAATMSSPGCAARRRRPPIRAPNRGCSATSRRAATGAARCAISTSSIHLAQRAHAPPSRRILDAEPDAAAALARAAALAGVRRFVYVSSIKAMGETTAPGRPFRAADPPHPEDAYGRAKLATERALAAVAAETGIELVILRPPLVYGPGVGGNFRALLRLARSGLPLPFAAARQPPQPDRARQPGRSDRRLLRASEHAPAGRGGDPAGPRRNRPVHPRADPHPGALPRAERRDLFALPEAGLCRAAPLPLLGAAFCRLTLSLQVDDGRDPGGAGLATAGGGRGGAGRNRPRFRGGVNCGGIDRRGLERLPFSIPRPTRLVGAGRPANVAICGTCSRANSIAAHDPTAHSADLPSRRDRPKAASRCAGERRAPELRGPVVASPAEPRHRNAIGSYSGSYADLPRARGRDASAGAGSPARPDRHRAGRGDRALAAMGRPEEDRLARPVRAIWSARSSPSRSRAGIDVRPTIAVTGAHINLPEIRQRIADRRHRPGRQRRAGERRDPRHQGGDRPGVASARHRRAVRRRRSRIAAHACSRRPAGCSPSW